MSHNLRLCHKIVHCLGMRREGTRITHGLQGSPRQEPFPAGLGLAEALQTAQ